MKRVILYVEKFIKFIWNGYADAFALKALRSTERYAKNGNTGAIEALAYMYECGTRVVQKNLVTAYCLYHALSEKNISSAREKMKLLEPQMTDTQLLEAKKYIDDWNEKNNSSG